MPQVMKAVRVKHGRPEAVPVTKLAEAMSYTSILKDLKKRVKLEQQGVTVRHLVPRVELEIWDNDPSIQIEDMIVGQEGVFNQKNHQMYTKLGLCSLLKRLTL